MGDNTDFILLLSHWDALFFKLSFFFQAP